MSTLITEVELWSKTKRTDKGTECIPAKKRGSIRCHESGDRVMLYYDIERPLIGLGKLYGNASFAKENYLL